MIKKTFWDGPGTDSRPYLENKTTFCAEVVDVELRETIQECVRRNYEASQEALIPPPEDMTWQMLGHRRWKVETLLCSRYEQQSTGLQLVFNGSYELMPDTCLAVLDRSHCWSAFIYPQFLFCSVVNIKCKKNKPLAGSQSYLTPELRQQALERHFNGDNVAGHFCSFAARSVNMASGRCTVCYPLRRLTHM